MSECSSSIETFSKLQFLGLKNLSPGWEASTYADIIERNFISDFILKRIMTI